MSGLNRLASTRLEQLTSVTIFCISMPRKKYDNTILQEKFEVHLKGRLRKALYLYAEDNNTTLAGAIRDAVRVLCFKQLKEVAKGREPKSK